MSSRGWGYLLENAGTITKSDMDAAQRLINECRKTGLLPLDICAIDDKRAADGLENHLKNLFAPVCAKYHVAFANGGGWNDINGRAAMMLRFAEHEASGRQCVLLYCGDHDPGGLNISDFLRSNFADLKRAVGWSPDRLIIDRFGLNDDFIEAQGLTWIDNTGRRSRNDAAAVLSVKKP